MYKAFRITFLTLCMVAMAINLLGLAFTLINLARLLGS